MGLAEFHAFKSLVQINQSSSELPYLSPSNYDVIYVSLLLLDEKYS